MQLKIHNAIWQIIFIRSYSIPIFFCIIYLYFYVLQFMAGKGKRLCTFSSPDRRRNATFVILEDLEDHELLLLRITYRFCISPILFFKFYDFTWIGFCEMYWLHKKLWGDNGFYYNVYYWKGNIFFVLRINTTYHCFPCKRIQSKPFYELVIGRW